MFDDTERLALLLAALPPVPPGWVAAAQELPQAVRSLDDLLARAEADRALRDRLVADLESALASEGITVSAGIVSIARSRMHVY